MAAFCYFVAGWFCSDMLRQVVRCDFERAAYHAIGVAVCLAMGATEWQ